MKRISIIFFLLLYLTTSHAQKQRDFVGYWSIYYPYIDDVQMVEIVFGITDLRHLSQNPSLQPDPNPRIFIFRNKEGKILQSYNNCGYNVKQFELIAPSEKIPENQLKEHPLEFYHYFTNCKRTNGYKYEDANIEKSKWGIINRKGEIIIKAKYEEVNIVDSIIVAKKNDKYGIIDKDENIIQAFEYNSRIQYYASKFPAAGNRNGKFVYLDRNGKIISKREYDYADMFWSSRARFKLKNKFGFIDSTGFEIVPPIYDHAESFYYNVAIVKLKGKFGMINNVGDVIQPMKYDRIESVRGDQLGVSTIGYKGYIKDKVFLFDKEGFSEKDKPKNALGKLKLKEINTPGDFTFCENPTILKKVQIDGIGSEEIVILRKCRGSSSRHGGTFDEIESYTIEQIEVWNIDKNKLLFTSMKRYQHDFNIFNVYLNPQRMNGTVGYQYDFNIDDNGIIKIRNIQKRKSDKKQKDKILNSDYPKSKSPDLKEGRYIYKNGRYIKR